MARRFGGKLAHIQANLVSSRNVLPDQGNQTAHLVHVVELRGAKRDGVHAGFRVIAGNGQNLVIAQARRIGHNAQLFRERAKRAVHLAGSVIKANAAANLRAPARHAQRHIARRAAHIRRLFRRGINAQELDDCRAILPRAPQALLGNNVNVVLELLVHVRSLPLRSDTLLCTFRITACGSRA